MKRILIPLLIITLFTGALHFFIYWAISFSFPEDSLLRQSIFALMLAGWILMPTGMIISMTKLKEKLRFVTISDYYWMGFFTIAFFFSLVETVFILFGYHEYSYWVLPISILISLWATYRGNQFPQVITHEISGPAAMRGLSLVQISDLHVGMPGLGGDWLIKIVETVNNLKPHMIAITGDLVDDQFGKVAPLLGPLANLQASKDKFYITGNHEYIRSGNWENRLSELGFTVLHNNHKLITLKHGTLLVAGVPDKMVNRFDQSLRSNPDQALKTDKLVNYKILLAHQPSTVFDLKTEKCDLILSGHTHGGQIFPFAFFVRLVQPVAMGFKTVKGILLFAHQGTGRWGPPMRWGTRSEIVQFLWI